MKFTPAIYAANREPLVFVFAGDPASGKSSAVEGVMNAYMNSGFEIASDGKKYGPFDKVIMKITAGKLFREVAEETGIMVSELSEYATANLAMSYLALFAKNKTFFESLTEDELEMDIDDYVNGSVQRLIEQKRLEFGGNPNAVILVDSRIAGFFFKNGDKSILNIRLTVQRNVAGKRILDDISNRKGELASTATLEDAMEEWSERRDNERQRFKSRYGFDICNLSNYDVVINSSGVAQSRVLELLFTLAEEVRAGRRPVHHLYRSTKYIRPGIAVKDALTEIMANLSSFTLIKSNHIYYAITGQNFIGNANKIGYKVEMACTDSTECDREYKLIPYEVLALGNEEMTKKGVSATEYVEALPANLQEEFEKKFRFKYQEK